MNYFLGNYTNNNKFRHNLFSFLKLFFERDSKNNTSYTSLGNVFRNSKWSDLKVQNIKNLFIKEFTLFLLLISTLTLLNIVGFRLYIVDIFFGIINDVILLSVDCISLFYVFILYVTTYRFSNKDLISLSGSSPKYTTFGNLKSSTFKDGSDYKIVNSLYKSSDKVSKLLTFESAKLGSNSSSIHKPLNLNNTYSLGLNSYNTLLDSDKVLTLSLNDLNQFVKNQHLLASSNNFSHNLNVAKSDRWLLKNSLIGEDLITNTYKYTQLKSLVGDNILSSKSSASNVWLSTNFKNIDSLSQNLLIFNPTELVNSLESNAGSFTDLTNFNFFEDSRFFVLKRSFFANQIRFNNLVYSSTYSPTKVLEDSNLAKEPSIFGLNSSLYNTSLPLNLDTLYLTSLLDAKSFNSENLTSKLDNPVFVSNQTNTLLTQKNLMLVGNLTRNPSLTWFSYFNY